MSIAKVIEITSRSEESIEDAVTVGLARAAETVHGIREAWINDIKVKVDDGRVTEYHVGMKLTFVVE
jgi:dodecin